MTGAAGCVLVPYNQPSCLVHALHQSHALNSSLKLLPIFVPEVTGTVIAVTVNMVCTCRHQLACMLARLGRCHAHHRVCSTSNAVCLAATWLYVRNRESANRGSGGNMYELEPVLSGLTWLYRQIPCGSLSCLHHPRYSWLLPAESACRQTELLG